jgi:diguanylate cyclase (GGDEF)-like protein
LTLLATIMLLIYVIARERAVHDHVQMDRRLELEELARDLDFKATTDPLTGLSNRLKFDQALSAEIRRARRFDVALSLVIYDVDHFKHINDAYGHLAGDQVLIKLSGFVAKRMRETDLLARWGGEEFVILLPLSDVSMAEQFAEILRGAIATLPFDHGKSVTCSFGVAQLAAGESAERLVARADEALYRGKRNGRNRVELASNVVGERKGIGSAA